MCSQKLKAYWITFFAYAAIHCLRMCYSYNKINIQKEFQLTKFYLGLLDAVLYFSYSFGVLFRYEFFHGRKLMTRVYFITATIVSVCFGFIAYLSIFQGKYGLFTNFSHILTKVLLTVAVAAFGFFHMAFYQISGSIVSGYYDPKTDSAQIGLWGATSSVGNITGFFVSNFIVEQLNLEWQVTFFLFAILNLIMAFVVFIYLPVPREDQEYIQQIFQLQNGQQIQNQHQQNKRISQRPIRTKHFINFIKKTLSSNIQARFVFITYIGLKAALYTFLMWFPIFLVSKGFSNVSGYVSTLFDLGSILGGYSMGRLEGISHKAAKSSRKSQNIFVQYLFRYRTVFFIVCIIGTIISFIFVRSSLYVYCPLTFLIGLFLGGSFNILSSHDVFVLGEKRLLHTDMLLNVPVGIGCFMIGLVQLITALMLKMNQKQNQPGQNPNYGQFFIVLLVLMSLSGTLMFARTFIKHKNSKQTLNQGDLQNKYSQL